MSRIAVAALLLSMLCTGCHSRPVVTGPDLDPLPTIVSIAAGWNHSLLLSADGVVYACGRNDCGQLGFETLEDCPCFAPVSGFGRAKVKAIFAGGNHNFAITEGDVLYGWGANESGQLGTGDTEQRTSPSVVSELTSFRKISCGFAHSAGIGHDGLYTWGCNSRGQLGYEGPDRLQPTLVSELDYTVDDVACGERHTVALLRSSVVACWGGNFWGQLGLWENSDIHDGMPVVGFPKGVLPANVQARIDQCYASHENRVYAWPCSINAQFVYNFSQTSFAPVLHMGFAGKALASVAAGRGCSIVVAQDGTIFHWGYSGAMSAPDGTGIENPQIGRAHV